MLKSKSVTGFVFSAALLLPAVFCPPAFSDITEAGAQETRRITVEASARQDVSLGQAIEKAVPPAVPVQHAGPADEELSAAAEKPAVPAKAEKPSEMKAQDPAKAAAAKPVQPQTGLPEAKPSPADFLKAGDTTVIHAGEADALEQAVASGVEAVPVAEDVLKVKPESSDHYSPIERNIGYFSNTIKKHFTRWLSRSGKYVDIMKGILRENYLPEDLVFLALIESGFNTKAYSPAKASGPWQFIKGTATRYGLRIDRWVDERRDPIKSTKAAAAYLRDLYRMFGSWPLAMASYNCGEGNIARAIRRNDTEDFWELRKTRSIPSETKEYVPRFVAAQMIAANPEQYGFDQLEYESPFEFDEVKLSQSTSLATVAKCCGVPESEIKELNPELLRGCTPPNRHEYTLRIPKGARETFLQNYGALPDHEKVAKLPKEPAPKVYVVRRGDTLKSIARKFDISVKTLAGANRVKATAQVKRGQRLKIPIDDGVAVAVASTSGEEKKTAKAKTAGPGGTDSAAEEASPSKIVAAKTYKVKKGDTLAGVARRHGMSVAKLAKLNGLSVKSRLRTGQKLALSQPQAGEKETVAKADPSKKAVSSSGKETAKKYASKKTYKVRRGDTLYSIAKKFNVSKEKLAKANSISGSVIRSGQKLIIPVEEEA